MAAILTSERGSQDKIVKYINECREMGIAILPPDVNVSDVFFTPTKSGIRFGLAAIKNVGESAITSIVAEQALQDRCSISASASISRTVNKRVIESLIKAGAFDSVDTRSRAALRQHRSRDGLGPAKAAREGSRAGRSLRNDGRQCRRRRHVLDPAEPWPEGLKLKHEKETLGFYITGHPLRKYAAEVKTYGNATTGHSVGKAVGFRCFDRRASFRRFA